MGNPPTQTDTFYRKIFGRFYGTTSSAKISSIPHPHRKGLDAYLPDGLSFQPLSYLYDDEVARFAWEGAVMKDLGSWARCYRNHLVNYCTCLFAGVLSISLYCMSWAFFFMITFFRYHSFEAPYPKVCHHDPHQNGNLVDLDCANFQT
jgi:hypothetical protein